MTLMDQLVGVQRTPNEGQMERELKNAIDYAVRIYGLTYVLDRGPSLISAMMGGTSPEETSVISSILSGMTKLPGKLAGGMFRFL